VLGVAVTGVLAAALGRGAWVGCPPIAPVGLGCAAAWLGWTVWLGWAAVWLDWAV
jgi:hypothetical protein